MAQREAIQRYFSKPKEIDCGILKEGQECTLFEDCREAHSNGALTPAEFSKRYPGWSIDWLVNYGKTNSIESLSERIGKMPQAYWETVREQLSP